MIAVIKGDIIGSRKIEKPSKWLRPLKGLLSEWGQPPRHWELVWGDFFQLEVSCPEDALYRALRIKALIKGIEPESPDKKISTIDVRMSVGIGDKTYTGKRISESNGQAFIHSGAQFERLKKDRTNLAVRSPWQDFDAEINLYLKLAGTIMDKWSVSSARLMEIVLCNPGATQETTGQLLGIRQNSVSGRRNRARADEILEIERVYRMKIKQHLQS